MVGWSLSLEPSYQDIDSWSLIQYRAWNDGTIYKIWQNHPELERIWQKNNGHIYVNHIYCSLQSHWNSYELISIFGFTKQVSGKICVKKNDVLLLTGWRLPPSLATFSVRSSFCHRMICYHVFISVSTRSVVNPFMCISLFLCIVFSRSLICFMLIKWLLFSSF